MTQTTGALDGAPHFKMERWQEEIAEHAQLHPNLVDRRWPAAKLADFWIVTSLHPSFRVRLLRAVGAHKDTVTEAVANYGLKILPHFDPNQKAIGVYETFSEDAKLSKSQIDQLRAVLKLHKETAPRKYSTGGALALLDATQAKDAASAFDHLGNAAEFAALPLFDVYDYYTPRALGVASASFVDVFGFHAFAGYCNALKRKRELD